MKIATSLKTYLVKEDYDNAFSKIKEDGFNACGIVIRNSIDYYMQNKDKFMNSDLDFCIHSNMTDTNIASLNEGIRKESVKQVKDAILFGKEINAIVNFHPGKFRNRFLVSEAYSNMELSMMEILSFADKHGVITVFENMEPHKKQLCVTKIQVGRVLEKFKKLDLCLDIAHAAMASQDFLEYYDEFKDRIKHIHISGLQEKRSHVEVNLKESNVDFSKFIKKIKDFNKIVRIENRTREDNIESLEFINEVIDNGE